MTWPPWLCMSIGIFAWNHSIHFMYIHTCTVMYMYSHVHVQVAVSCTHTAKWDRQQWNRMQFPKPVEELQSDVLPEMPLAPPESDNGSDSEMEQERDTLVSLSGSSGSSCQAHLAGYQRYCGGSCAIFRAPNMGVRVLAVGSCA